MFEDVDDFAARLDLQSAARALTPCQAVALRLWLTGYTQAEIGEIEGVSQQAVSCRIARAQTALRNTIA